MYRWIEAGHDADTGAGEMHTAELVSALAGICVGPLAGICTCGSGRGTTVAVVIGGVVPTATVVVDIDA